MYDLQEKIDFSIFTLKELKRIAEINNICVDKQKKHNIVDVLSVTQEFTTIKMDRELIFRKSRTEGHKHIHTKNFCPPWDDESNVGDVLFKVLTEVDTLPDPDYNDDGYTAREINSFEKKAKKFFSKYRVFVEDEDERKMYK